MIRQPPAERLRHQPHVALRVGTAQHLHRVLELDERLRAAAAAAHRRVVHRARHVADGRKECLDAAGGLARLVRRQDTAGPCGTHEAFKFKPFPEAVGGLKKRREWAWRVPATMKNSGGPADCGSTFLAFLAGEAEAALAAHSLAALRFVDIGLSPVRGNGTAFPDCRTSRQCH